MDCNPYLKKIRQVKSTMTKPLPPQTTRGKFVYFIWNNLPRFVLLLMIALIFVLYGEITEQTKMIAKNKAEEVKAEKPPVNSVVLTLSPTTITDRINLPGAIEPWTRLQLMAKIGGTIDAVMVSEGSHVKKGDILARIEDADYRIALDRADATYKLAKNDFERDRKSTKKGSFQAPPSISIKQRCRPPRRTMIMQNLCFQEPLSPHLWMASSKD